MSGSKEWGNRRGRTMLMYLRGEKDIDDLARRAGRPLVGMALDSRDMEFLTWVSENKDLVTVNFTELSRRAHVPPSTVYERWKRLKRKGLRLRISVVASDEGGCSPGKGGQDSFDDDVLSVDCVA